MVLHWVRERGFADDVYSHDDADHADAGGRDVHHDDDKYDIKVNEYHYKPGEYYEVPYRCLISKHCDNLICGGRIISTSFKVEASVRIQATLHDIAEVIGKACAYSLNNNIDLNKINGKVLRTFE